MKLVKWYNSIEDNKLYGRGMVKRETPKIQTSPAGHAQLSLVFELVIFIFNKNLLQQLSKKKIIFKQAQSLVYCGVFHL